MNLPQLPLGVAVMDDDHFVLEQMFAQTAGLADADLPAHIDAIVAELAAHFEREEAEMQRVGVPILHCHQEQHAALLLETYRLRKTFEASPPPLQREIVVVLAQHVADHVASVDRVTSTFFDREVEFSERAESSIAFGDS